MSTPSKDPKKILDLFTEALNTPFIQITLGLGF